MAPLVVFFGIALAEQDLLDFCGILFLQSIHPY
jgi:hypothetical protein